jgi:hypothetical protein
VDRQRPSFALRTFSGRYSAVARRLMLERGRGMSEDAAEEIMSQHSKLWSDSATELPFDVAIRPVNPDLGAEIFLSRRLFGQK